MAPGLGLEPRQEDPESPVLPLHHPGRNSHYYSKDKIKCNPFFEIFLIFFIFLQKHENTAYFRDFFYVLRVKLCYNQ